MSKTFLLVRFVLPLLFISPLLQAQSLYPVSMEEKANTSSLIVEGKVIARQGFWNQAHTMIFTSNRVEVYKLFKGTLLKDTVEIVTTGGTVGNRAVISHELLSLNTGELGIFFCQPAHASLLSPYTGKTQLQVTGSMQGFLKYDLSNQTAAAPFSSYTNITQTLYQEIMKYTGTVYENRNPDFVIEMPSVAQMSVNAASITSFTPTTVNSGALNDAANNVLTITGTGFGAAPSGSAGVSFDNADDGAGGAFVTVAYNSNYIVSWSDTEIKVKVPDKAGTGSFRVLDNAGLVAASTTGLTVFYSVLNAGFSRGGPNFYKEFNLMNTNGSGGYTIQYSTNTTGGGVDFNASTAKATFQRALTTWRENAGINFSEGGSSSVAVVAEDGLNLVLFDNSNAGAGVTPLPAGVLAACYSQVSMCTPLETNDAQILEFDIIVRNNGVSSGSTTFNMGPCPPLSGTPTEVDLETVMLHELGHAIGLGHIIDTHQGGTIGNVNPAKLMNYSVVYSVKRSSPDYSALMGALYCRNPNGSSYGGCGLFTDEMTPISYTSPSRDNCPASFPITTTPTNTTLSFDLVHAGSNKNEDPVYTKLSLDNTGRAVTNNAFYALKTGPLGGLLGISITSYATTPTSYTCPVYTPLSLPTKGVELILYQLSSCPQPNAYPLPVAIRNFDGNGPLADITGLTANTNYLMMVDGIENTKASFNLTFTGAALPSLLERFDGKSTVAYNDLSWMLQTDGIASARLEKSGDGFSFKSIQSIEKINLLKTKAFRDWEPLPTAYYRLALKMEDGSMSYSKTLLLKRELALGLHLYPNPATGFFVLTYKDLEVGRMQLSVRNEQGQLVEVKSFVSEGFGTFRVNTLSYKPGSYRVSIYNGKGQVKSHQLLVIQP